MMTLLTGTIKTHARPSGLRHPAISGVHMSKELRKKYAEELMAIGEGTASKGVECPRCSTRPNEACRNSDGTVMPLNEVHLERAEALV